MKAGIESDEGGEVGPVRMCIKHPCLMQWILESQERVLS